MTPPQYGESHMSFKTGKQKNVTVRLQDGEVKLAVIWPNISGNEPRYYEGLPQKWTKHDAILPVLRPCCNGSDISIFGG